MPLRSRRKQRIIIRSYPSSKNKKELQSRPKLLSPKAMDKPPDRRSRRKNKSRKKHDKIAAIYMNTTKQGTYNITYVRH